jgi:hypothetical protein
LYVSVLCIGGKNIFWFRIIFIKTDLKLIEALYYCLNIIKFFISCRENKLFY